jgi:uncharacterized protein YcfJ
LQTHSTYAARKEGIRRRVSANKKVEAIMFGKSATFAVALAILAVSGCASFPGRDPALDDARLSVDAARRNPQVAMYASAELDQAAVTLRQADDLAASGGRYEEVHQLALLANQRAATAQDVARLRSEQAALVAQRTATDARIQADVTQRQAAAAQLQAAEAQRQADQAQRLAAAPTAYDYRRRENERLYEAPVTSVRAVVGPPQQRCWVERQVVDTGSPGINVPGAVVGGIVGGILGHQIGSGRGRDLATGIGAAGGAVVGANVGRDAPGTVYTQDVQRCENVSTVPPVDYWDVTYNFGGYEHHVQTTSPPGRTILVNAQGEPRV